MHEFEPGLDFRQQLVPLAQAWNAFDWGFQIATCRAQVRNTGLFCGAPVISDSIYCVNCDISQTPRDKLLIEELKKSSKNAPSFWVFKGFKHKFRLPNVLQVQAKLVTNIFDLEDKIDEEYKNLAEMFKLFEIQYRKEPREFSDVDLVQKFGKPHEKNWDEIFWLPSRCQKWPFFTILRH